MATALYNTPRLVDFVLSEAKGQRSRENIVVTLAGAALKSGTVLMKAGAKYVPFTTGGTNKAVAILYQAIAAATGDVKAVGFVRDLEVNRFRLTGLAGTAEADLLAQSGIIVRGDATAKTFGTPAL